MKKLLSVLFITGASLSLFAWCTSENKIHMGDTISLVYTATFSDWEVFDQNTEQNPLIFTVGEHQVIQWLDEGVVGLKVGKKKTVTILPNKWYGALYNENLIQKIGKIIFEKLEIATEIWTIQQLDDLQWVIKGSETDADGNELILFDINPKQTRDTLKYTVHILAKQTASK